MEQEELLLELRDVREKLDKLIDKVGYVNAAEGEQITHVEISNLELLFLHFPKMSGVEGVSTADPDVNELFGELCSDGDEVVSVCDYERGEIPDKSWLEVLNVDVGYGEKVKHMLGSPFVFVDCVCLGWGYEKWNELLSVVNANYINFGGEFTSSFCYDGTGVKDTLSLLSAADVFVGEYGWKYLAATVLGCTGCVLLNKRTNNPRMVELSVGRELVDIPLQMVCNTLEQLVTI